MNTSLAERDKKVIWHPFTKQYNQNLPIAISKAKDSILYNEDGSAYIDAISSWWVTIHGHGNEYIAKKIYEQALKVEQVIFAGFTHQPAVDLAEKLLPILPNNFDKIFYSDNGSTSVEVAIKMCLQFWANENTNNESINGLNIHHPRKKILAFNNSYHGDTFGGMSVSDRSVFTAAFKDYLFDVVFIDVPSENNITQLINFINTEGNEFAAFIYEPLVQGAGGICMYNAQFLDELLFAIKQQHIICIADEVMTGFGRTGKLFASEYVTNKPDIICLSKGLTGGTMALGVTACTLKIYEAFVSSNVYKTFFHGHSFTANPLACTAALASLELFEINDSLKKIHWLSHQNQIFVDKHTKQSIKKLFKNLRCLGTILAFELVEGKDEYLNNIAQTITQKALENGIYIRPLGNTVYIMPPYCILEDELQKVYVFLESIMY
ncbi:MAG: adenosylmethionine--8-amino-7-oxononanoate transaminase [Chitinophagaceae bacterium]